MIGYNDGGVPDTKYVVTKELTLEDAAWRTRLPPQSCIDKNSPIGFIFKENKVLCMKCRRKFECPTTEKKMINDCHALQAWSGHPRAPESETYIIKIEGKDVYVPKKVRFDRDDIMEVIEPVPKPEGSTADCIARIPPLATSSAANRQSTKTMQGISGLPVTARSSESSLKKPHPQSPKTSSKMAKKLKAEELEVITLSEDESGPDAVPDIEKVPSIRNPNEAIPRRKAAPPRRRDQGSSDNSSIKLVVVNSRGAQTDAARPEFEPPANFHYRALERTREVAAEMLGGKEMEVDGLLRRRDESTSDDSVIDIIQIVSKGTQTDGP